jgi:hypothetical protein
MVAPAADLGRVRQARQGTGEDREGGIAVAVVCQREVALGGRVIVENIAGIVREVLVSECVGGAPNLPLYPLVSSMWSSVEESQAFPEGETR